LSSCLGPVFLNLDAAVPSGDVHGRPHIGANGVSWPPGKMDEKLKSENMQKRAVFYVCYILRAIRVGRCRERHYSYQIFIQIYFRTHHFIVVFKIFFASGSKGALTPQPKSCGRSW